MKLRIIFLLISGIYFNSITAQSKYTLTGTVNDSTGAPVEYGIAALFKIPDSTFKGYSTIDSGFFKFMEIEPGDYFLKITSLGFEDKYQSIVITGETDINIILKSTPVTTKDVEVTAFRNAFSYKNGNIKVEIENTVFSTIPDVMDLLSRLPTVQVSPNRDAVTIIGAGGPVIYIDNQRATMNDLSVLSVNDIKSIEIIHNPSAKYEAEGRAVILITRKINTQQGYRFDIIETAMMKRFFENRSAFNASIKKRKTEYKFNLQHYVSNPWESIQGNLRSDTHNYYSDYKATTMGPRNMLTAGIGIFRQLKENDYFSININVRHQEEPFSLISNNSLIQAGATTNVESRSSNFSRRPYLNALFNYQKKITGSTRFFAGGQYSHYERSLASTIQNNFNNTLFEPSEKRMQNYLVDVGVVRVDMETNIKNVKWEYGGIVNHARAGTFFNINNIAASDNRVTEYYYSENNQSVYSQVSGKLKNTEYSLGLRMENTDLEGGFKDSSNQLLDRKFMYLFPRVNITVPLDSSKTLTFNYTRNIRRPDYAIANQITNYITPFFEISNNINLNPSLTNEVSAIVQYKNFSVRAAYAQTQNLSAFVAEYDSAFGKLRLIRKNLALEQGGRLHLVLPFQYKWFTSSNSIMFIVNRVTDERAVTYRTSPFIHAGTNNQFKLPKEYMFTVMAWVTTKRYQGIFERNAMFAADLSLSKAFKSGFTVTLNAFDIFRSLDYTETFTINGIYSSTTYYENVREFSVAVKYSFGKKYDSKFKNREINGDGRLN